MSGVEIADIMAQKVVELVTAGATAAISERTTNGTARTGRLGRMRLIDADALMQALGIFKDYEHGNPHFMNSIETNRELVIGAPTIDAEPVRHGRWVICEDGCGDTHYQCSACGDEWTLIDGTPQENGMKYCPHCGAKMDGGEPHCG